MRILVTGGAGFIGSHIVDTYLAAGHEVAIVDNLQDYSNERQAYLPQEARFFQVDITNQDAIHSVFDTFRPEVVNHHAAQQSVAVSTKKPIVDAQINVLGLLNVLQECTRTHVKKVIMASSAATFGNVSQLPINEESLQLPESPYGITKLIAQHYLRYWNLAYGLPYTLFYYGNVYGPRQDPNGEAGVIAIFIKNFLRHTPVRIDWDGQQQKDFVYVQDVVQANLLALKDNECECYCIASETGTSVQSIYDNLVSLAGWDVPIIHASQRQGDVYRISFDCSKAKQKLHWQPSISFLMGLSRTYKAAQVQMMSISV
jgi:UDP-glucose 4-epimerase